MANTFLLAQGHEIGRSLAEPDRVGRRPATSWSGRVAQRGDRRLPTDVSGCAATSRPNRTTVPDRGDPGRQPRSSTSARETVARFDRRIAAARTIFWNGPMGVFERSRVRRRHDGDRPGGRRRRAPSPSSAAAIRWRRSSTWAWPTRSPTSRPAAAPRWSSSKGGSCPESPHWSSRPRSTHDPPAARRRQLENEHQPRRGGCPRGGGGVPADRRGGRRGLSALSVADSGRRGAPRVGGRRRRARLLARPQRRVHRGRLRRHARRVLRLRHRRALRTPASLRRNRRPRAQPRRLRS